MKNDDPSQRRYFDVCEEWKEGAFVADLVHCQGHSAPLMHLCYEDGEYGYAIAPEGTAVGDVLDFSDGAKVHHGNVITLQNIPEGYKPVLYYVHRLVAQHFIPNPDNLAEVNHKDFDITNNKLENLEWVTSLHNKKNKNRTNTKIGKLLKNEKLIQEGINNYLKYQRKSYLMILWGMYDKAVEEVLRLKKIEIRTIQKPKR